MEQMEDKLSALLSNPDMMQKIMSMAQSLGATPAPPQSTPAPTPLPSAPELDVAALQKIMHFAQQTGIDRDQQALLKALGPFLTHERIGKLEKAMRAAKLANLATSALGQF